MRIEQDHIIFEYPGGEISFHKDLKRYFEIRQIFLAYRDQIKIASGWHDQAKAQQVLSDVTGNLIMAINQFVLPTLTNLGIYNVTADDFLDDNPGLLQIFEATSNFSGNISNLKQAYQNWANVKKQEAAARAQQNITGLDYGVISSDIVAHAIYNAKRNATIKNQTTIAEIQYDRDARAIDSAARIELRHEQEKLGDAYSKKVVEEIKSAYEYVISKYCKFLERAKTVDFTFLSEIDEARSTAILDNLGYVERKEPVIYQAIQLCPYNVNIYSAMCDQEIPFQQVHKDILFYFELLDGLCEYIKESCVHTGSTMSAAYSMNQYQILQLSFLKQVEVKDAARLCLLPDFNRLLDLYAQIALTIQGDQTLFELSRIRYPISFDLSKANSFNETAVNCKELFCNELEKERQSFTPNEINFCETQCNIDVFSSLSSWFKFEVHSFEDLNTFIMSKWDEGIKNDENKRKTQKIIDEISAQKEKIQKLTEQIYYPRWKARGILLLMGLFCMSPIFIFPYNGIGLDAFFSIMTAGFIEFIVSIACLFFVGVGIWFLFYLIYDILFANKRLQKQLREESQKLLEMEKKRETIASQEIK